MDLAGFAACLWITTQFACLIHSQDQMGIDTQSSGDGIVGERINQYVLSAEVTKDLRLIQPSLGIGEELVF